MVCNVLDIDLDDTSAVWHASIPRRDQILFVVDYTRWRLGQLGVNFIFCFYSGAKGVHIYFPPDPNVSVFILQEVFAEPVTTNDVNSNEFLKKWMNLVYSSLDTYVDIVKAIDKPNITDDDIVAEACSFPVDWAVSASNHAIKMPYSLNISNCVYIESFIDPDDRYCFPIRYDDHEAIVTNIERFQNAVDRMMYDHNMNKY